MQFEIVKNYKEALRSSARYIILMGGRGAGRSYFASQYVCARLQSDMFFRCAIMRFIATDIRSSIYQEIIDRLEEQNFLDKCNVKENPLEISFGFNFIRGIGFRKSTSDQKSKLKSLAGFNCVVIEEADEISEEDFIQLDDTLRTVNADIKIILLLNPPDKNHWIIKRWFNLIASAIEGFYIPQLKTSEAHNTLYIHTTWKDNAKNLNQSTKDNFQRYKQTRPDHFYNMIRGLVSEGARGRIFKNWQIINDKEYEELDFPVSYGLDFGFTNDPTALIEIKEHNNKIYLRELIYETGLINKRISEKMELLGVNKNAFIYADNAEAKSIAELQGYGWNVLPAEKGQGSVNAGLDLLLGKEVYYTESSKNIALESQEYRWAIDRNKEPTNIPIDKYNHAIDAIRYNVFSKSCEAFVGIV